MENLQNTKKRVRSQPAKKWTATEENNLVCFLKENRNFEKPTAQVFYNKFIRELAVDCSWVLVRSKVRNMRVKYNKAKAFENSTGAGAMNEGESMNDILKQMCPYFEDFDDIFNGRDVENVALCESEAPSDGDNTPPSSAISTPTNKKGIYSRTALSDILDKQDSLIEFKKQKLEVDEKMKQAQLDLEREKFEHEKKKCDEEFKIKQMEIESNERMKKYELDIKLKLALKEMELKNIQ